MIKNKMAKMVGTTMAVAIMLSVAVPTQVSAGEVTNQKINQQTNIDTEQFGYAQQELNIVLEMLEKDDFSKLENYDRALRFMSAAQDRIKNMDEENEYVADLQRVINETRPSMDMIHRVLNDIQCLQGSSEETREGWIDSLNEAIIYGRENGLLNYATCDSAIKILHSYANGEANLAVQAPSEDNFDTEQWGYAREEIQMALEIVDNEDLTNTENYEKMVAFTTAAKQRLEGMDSNAHVDDLYRFVEILQENGNIAVRIISDIQNLKQASEDTKEGWIDALNEAVIYARENGLLNHKTISTATEILHQYAK